MRRSVPERDLLMKLSPNHCGECRNCAVVQRAQASVMKVVCALPGEGRVGASTEAAELWNETLREYPCLNPPKRPNPEAT